MCAWYSPSRELVSRKLCHEGTSVDSSNAGGWFGPLTGTLSESPGRREHPEDHTVDAGPEGNDVAAGAVVDGSIPATCDGANDRSAMTPGFILVTVEAAFEAADLRRFVIPLELFHVFEFAHTTANSEDGYLAL